MNSNVLYRLATQATLVALLAGCAGSGGGSTVTPTAISPASHAGKGTLSISFKIPMASSTAQTRHREFLSDAAQSVTVAVNGGTPSTINLSNCSANATNSAQVCPIIGVIAPAGADTVTVSAYDATNAGGNLLGSGSVNATVTAGQTTPVDISLNGAPTHFALDLSNSVPATGSSSTIALTPFAFDADNYLIIGTYTTGITVTDNGSASEVTLNKTTLSGSTDSITVTYSGTGTTPVVFTGTLTGTTTTNTVTLNPGASFGELAVGNFSTGTPYCGIDVYNAAGNGSVQPVAKDRGSGENDSCGNVAVAPNGDVILEGPTGLYVWYGYASNNTYKFLSLSDATGVHFDSSGDLYADTPAVNGNVAIEEYGPGYSDNDYPVRTIDLPPVDTQVLGTSSVATYGRSESDKAGNLWFPGQDGLDEFSIVNGPSTELRSIKYGSALKAINAFAFGPSNEIWICDASASPNQVIKLAPTATTANSPANRITGSYINNCQWVEVDSSGNVYVLTPGNVINVFASTANGAATPIRSLQLNSGTDLGIFALLD